MQNKTQVCTQDFLVQVCCDFYCEEAISEAKTLLYKHVKTKGRLIGRRGAQKSVHEMRDIYQVLLEMEPTDKTTFVAHNLANLPPLSMDNTDTLRLLKEIENVKSDLRSMQIAQEDIVTRSGCWGFLLRLLPITETTLEYSLGPFILPRKPSLHVQAI